MNAPNFRCVMASAKKARLEIYDQIGPDWAGMISAQHVSRALSDAGDVTDIEVRINSPGGSLFEGLAIYNILKSHPAQVRVKVDGVAASSASAIAMAGDVVEVPKNALMMIHDPSVYVQGNKEELLKSVELLDKATSSCVETYLAKNNKKNADEIRQMMADETWMTGDEAVAAGFADTVLPELKVSGGATALAADLNNRFRRAPTQLAALCSYIPKHGVNNVSTPNDANMSNAADDAAKQAEIKAAADAQIAAAAKSQAEAVTAERKRAADINAACNLAGSPELAAKFIDDNASLVDVQAVLIKQLSAKRPPTDGGSGDPANSAPDENKKYKDEYAQNKTAYASAGLSEDDYIKTRRVDDGIDNLTTKAA